MNFGLEKTELEVKLFPRILDGTFSKENLTKLKNKVFYDLQKERTNEVCYFHDDNKNNNLADLKNTIEFINLEENNNEKMDYLFFSEVDKDDEEELNLADILYRNNNNDFSNSYSQENQIIPPKKKIIPKPIFHVQKDDFETNIAPERHSPKRSETELNQNSDESGEYSLEENRDKRIRSNKVAGSLTRVTMRPRIVRTPRGHTTHTKPYKRAAPKRSTSKP
jgi:hypothetical protein